MRTNLTRCFELIMTMEISRPQGSSLQQRRHSSGKFAWGKATPTSRTFTGVAQRESSTPTSLTQSQPSFGWRTSGSSTKLQALHHLQEAPAKFCALQLGSAPLMKATFA